MKDKNNALYDVAEVVPLKQGLKPLNKNKYIYKKITVAEVVPLKQGLKHKVFVGFTEKILCCRGSSIKTRIETT